LEIASQHIFMGFFAFPTCNAASEDASVTVVVTVNSWHCAEIY